MYGWWLMIPFPSPRWYPALVFLNTKVRGVNATMKRRGERLSPWKIPLLMFASPNASPQAVSSVLHVLMLLFISTFKLSAAPKKSLVQWAFSYNFLLSSWLLATDLWFPWSFSDNPFVSLVIGSLFLNVYRVPHQWKAGYWSEIRNSWPSLFVFHDKDTSLSSILVHVVAANTHPVGVQYIQSGMWNQPIPL